MKLSNWVNAAQKIGAFTLIYFFSASSYQAQIVTEENLTNSSSAKSVQTVCNQDVNLVNSFDKVSLSTSTLAMFEGEVEVKNDFSLINQNKEHQFSVSTKEKNQQRAFSLGQFFIVNNSGNCYPDCQKLPLWQRCSGTYSEYCGGCPECDPSED